MKKRDISPPDHGPFQFGEVAAGETFTDREEATARLLANFEHGVNTILFSPRRWGKTSLVKKVIRLAQSDRRKVVFLDIFSCRSEEEFYDMFAWAVLKQTASRWEELLENARTLLTHIAPKFSFGGDPMADFSLSLEIDTSAKDLREVLDLPQRIAEKQGWRIVVCIDEFQQIAEFHDSKNFQKRLRTAWQHQEQVSYCLFGSKNHLMNELFEKRSLPFYKFGDVNHLSKIATEDWVRYICGRFDHTGKSISAELAERICRAVDNHSSYVQHLSWLVWIHTQDRATEQDFLRARQELIDQNSPLFENQTENLSAHQMNFLRALCDGVTHEFSSQPVLQKYRLGSSANVSIVKRALLKKELIEVTGKQIDVADPVLKLWLTQLFARR